MSDLMIDPLRKTVPTARQLQASPVVAEEIVLPEADARRTDEPDGPSVGERFRSWLRDLNPRAIPGSKLPLLVFVLIALVDYWAGQAILLSLPEAQADLGLSLTATVTITSLLFALTNILGMPMGYLVDRVKRVWLVRIGAIINAAGIGLAGLAGGVGAMVGGRSLISVSQSVSGPIGAVPVPMLADYYPPRFRGRVLGLMTMAGQAGLLLAVGVSGWMLERYNWRLCLLVISAVAAAIALPTFLMREPVRGESDRREAGVDEADAVPEQDAPSFVEGVRAAFAIRTVRLLAVGGLISSVSIGPVVSLTQLTLANKFLLSPSERSLWQFVATAVSIPSLLFGSAWIDRTLVRRPRSVAVALGAISGLSAMLLMLEALAPTLPLFLIPQILGTAITAALLPAFYVILSLAVPARIRGIGIQALAPFSFIGSLLAPIVAGYTSATSPQGMFLAFSPFFLLGTVLFMAIGATLGPDMRAARAASLALEEVQAAAARAQKKILVVRDVDVAYDGVQVLFNVDLDVHDGEVVALVGTNGAGKSTLLRAICGLQQVANGAVVYDGRDVTASPTYENARRGLIYMPGGQGVFPALTVRQNLESALAKGEADSIDQALTLFPSLRERLGTQAGKLSGGEQQMVALGQALLMRPRLLMIDELSLGLAPSVIEQLLAAIRQLQSDGTTVLLVEQSLNVALTIADRAVFMDRGQVQFDGPTEDLLARPDLVRAVFLGGGAGGDRSSSRRKNNVTTDVEVGNQLAATDITLSFGGVHALTDVSIEVAAGEIVGVIGPNGAGKTTLFDVLSGYLKPDTGRVLLRDRDVTSLTPDARARLGLGRAFQNARLFPPLTVRENIAIALERKAMKSAFLAAIWAPPARRNERKLRELIDGYIELLGLVPYADKFVRELSTGTRRAVEVACQMAANPKVLLLDEPSSGLAQAESEALGPTLARLVKETGCGMLIVEHDIPLITSIADRLVAMELGRVIASGAPDQVMHDSAVLSSYLAASNDVIERSGSRVGSVLAAIAAPEEN